MGLRWKVALALAAVALVATSAVGLIGYRSTEARLIDEVRGVIDVTNQIKIRPGATDPEVKRAIVRALHRHATIEAARIDVAIVDGKVTLSGVLDQLLLEGTGCDGGFQSSSCRIDACIFEADFCLTSCQPYETVECLRASQLWSKHLSNPSTRSRGRSVSI